MARKRKSRSKGRRSSGLAGASSASSVSASNDERKRKAFDLMVPLPKDPSGRGFNQLILNKLLDQLEFMGYTDVALTHTIFGRIRQDDDSIQRVFSDLNTRLPDLCSNSVDTIAASVSRPSSKRAKLDQDNRQSRSTSKTASSTTSRTIRAHKRLHCIIENLSDIAMFNLSTSSSQVIGSDANANATRRVLEQYDIVSAAPHNDETFQSLCAQPSFVNIITLDYTIGRGTRLPYRIRPADIASIRRNNIALEIPIAAAILNPKHRKSFVQTCREVQMACMGQQRQADSVPILFSSGNRELTNDVGAMALRSCDDVRNLVCTVCQWKPSMMEAAMQQAPLAVLRTAQTQRHGAVVMDLTSRGTLASLLRRDASCAAQDDDNDDDCDSVQRGDKQGAVKDDGDDKDGHDDGDEGMEDGFISMA